MSTPTRLPNKVERLELITEWVDNFVVAAGKLDDNASKQDVDSLVSEFQIALLDQAKATSFDIKGLGFLGTVLFKRAEFLGLPMTIAALLALTYISERPGDAVMYLTVLKHLFVAEQSQGIPTMVSYRMIKDTIPKPPPRAFLDRQWEAQKWNGVNLVDLMGPNDFLLTAAEAEELAKQEVA